MAIDWTWTLWAIGSFLAFIVIEIKRMLEGGPTLSATVRGMGRRYPWFAVLVCSASAALMAHFFWQPK